MKKDSRRCSYTEADGRRCGQPCLPAATGASGRNSLCLSHWKQRQRERQAGATADELLGNSTEFHTAADVNRLLGNLLSLVAHDRIPTRKATVIAYIVQLLMNSLAGMQREERVERFSKKFGDLLSYVQGQVEQEMQEEAKRKSFERAAKRNEAPSDVQIAFIPSEEAKN